MFGNEKAIDLKRRDAAYAQAERQEIAERKRNALVGGALVLGITASAIGILRRLNPFRLW